MSSKSNKVSSGWSGIFLLGLFSSLILAITIYLYVKSGSSDFLSLAIGPSPLSHLFRCSLGCFLWACTRTLLHRVTDVIAIVAIILFTLNISIGDIVSFIKGLSGGGG